MSFNNFEELSVEAAIRKDRANLFTLADKVIAAAQTRKWQLWVSDAKRAYFLTQFLNDVLTKSPQHIETPPIVHIAISRSVRKHPEHQEAIAQRLARTGITGNALILSEFTSTWRSIAMLEGHLRQAGATEVDAAILNIGESPYVEPSAKKPDNIFSGQSGTSEPGLCSDILTDAIPQATVLGYAEPQPDPNADLALHDQVSGAFRDLAQAYIASRRSS